MPQTPTGGSATPAPAGDGPTADDAGTVPAPRSGIHLLPRRTRGRDAGLAPDGSRYAAADETTLNRLLTGLREI